MKMKNEKNPTARKNHNFPRSRHALSSALNCNLPPLARVCVCVCALGEGNDGALSFCLPLLLLAGGRDGPSAGELEGRGFEVDAAVLGVGVKDAPPKESTSSLPRSRLCERRRLAGKTRHFCIDFEANSDSRRRGASRSSEAATRIRKGGDVAGELVVVAADDDDLFFVFNEKEIQGVLRARRLARAHRPHDRGKHEEGQGTETEGERERRAWEEAGGNSRRLALPICWLFQVERTMAQREERGGCVAFLDFLLPLSYLVLPSFSFDHHPSKQKKQQPRTGSGPIELGPIGMTVGASSDGPAQARVGREEEERNASSSSSSSSSETEKERVRRLSSLSTEEWRARYEPDGCVDLWVVEEFNAGSRLVGGRAAHLQGPEAAGAGSGEGRVLERAGPVATHSVKIFNKATAQTVEVVVEVPVHKVPEEDVQVPLVLQQERITQLPVVVFVEVPEPVW